MVPRDRDGVWCVGESGGIPAPLKTRQLINVYGCMPPPSSDSTGTEAKNSMVNTYINPHLQTAGNSISLLLL